MQIISREKTLRFLAFSDVHMPEHDPAAVDWLISQIIEWRPDRLVNVGDAIDADAASRWPSEAEHTLEEEYGRVDAFLQKCEEALRAGAPAPVNPSNPSDALMVWVLGNHESNLISPHRIPKKIRSLCDFRKHVKACERWKLYDYSSNPSKCVHRIGQVAFVHGFRSGTTAPCHTAQVYGEEWGLTVFGHTHRPLPVQRCKLGALTLNRWVANGGALIRLDPPPDYMNRNNMIEWGQGIVRGVAVPCREMRRGRYWEAETVVRQMAWSDPFDECAESHVSMNAVKG